MMLMIIYQGGWSKYLNFGYMGETVIWVFGTQFAGLSASYAARIVVVVVVFKRSTYLPG